MIKMKLYFLAVFIIIMNFSNLGLSQVTNIYLYDSNNLLYKIEYSNGMDLFYTYDELGNRLSQVVTINQLPGQAGIISGSASVCQGQNGIVSSISPINNATSYIWSLPKGATLASGINTNSITVNYSDSAITGNISVYGINEFGNGDSSTLMVTVNQKYNHSDVITICEGDSYKGHAENGIYTENLQSVSGCDSIINTILTVNPKYNHFDSISICEGEKYKKHTISGTYVEDLKTTNGCDSIVTTILKVNPKYNQTDNISLCEGELYKGHTVSGTYVEYLQTVYGCDSIVTTVLTVNPEYDRTDTISICEGETYKGHSTSGAYTENLQTVFGCDSIVTTILTVHEVYQQNDVVSICEGETHKGHATTGIYIENLQTANGCDSIVTTNITVNPVYVIMDNVSLCEGETYKEHTESGTYVENLKTVNGCDSIVTTNLTVSLTSETNLIEIICQNDSIKIDSLVFKENGNYVVTLINQYGCDSVVTLDLTVNPLPNVYLGVDTTILSTETFVLNAGESFKEYLWSNSRSSQIIIIDSLVGIGVHEFTVTVKDENNCSNSDTIVITIERSPTAIISINEKIGIIKVYPNPTTGDINLSVENIIDKTRINIILETGQIVFDKEYYPLEGKIIEQIDLKKYPNGIYIIQVTSNEIKKIEKLILNR